ncbi:energy transducer TonB [Rhodanobacter sp. FW510-R12]|uniref:energy transducer TonB n=1 Tax=unclassified Rhodanobacter TaxID=2621553 RepID=UPI0007AA424E|nr:MULTISPECIES: energy transducer TonB [unclassified Rhodanobacter]KZC17569.1 energy transducer TonB [Rhodanobacter sp. FW104-R8]KZC28737.1 energy transducer TonB [Rhodanobacter sp. FW510-T8]KZC33139.1 energy transducer TonB [Rhodanobacter sp. FW510-R10]
MDTRYTLNARRYARGAAKPMLIAIISIFVLLAVGAWFLIIKPHQELIMAESGGHPSTPVSTATRAAAAAPANVAGMDIDQLLAEARTAMNEQRYLAPAGNNAFEFYLRVLQKEPGNKVASDALRETFPFAATSAEQSINSRDFNEAQRQIDLLAKADPANFTLTILRSKLDAQRKTVDKQQEQEKAAAQLAAQKAAAEKQAAEQLAEQQKAQLAAQQKAEASRAAQPSRQAAAGQSATAAADGSSVAGNEGGESAQTNAAVLVKGASARYPTAAMRARQEGWVVVSFTVDADGKTSDVKVVESQPRHVFDRAAMDAVERYQFTPAMRNGVAVSSTKQQRIEFKL